MPLEPPNLGKVAETLTSVLEELRHLSDANPREPVYARGVERIEVTLAELESLTEAPKAMR